MDQKQIRTSSMSIKHTGSVQMKFYSRDWLIQSIIIYKWRIIRGREGDLEEKGAY